MSANRTKMLMQDAARLVDTLINPTSGPRQNGFVVLVFPLDQPDGARTNYVSNVERQSIVAALKEIVARFEGRAIYHGTKQ